jgi:hypothetical protein
VGNVGKGAVAVVEIEPVSFVGGAPAAAQIADPIGYIGVLPAFAVVVTPGKADDPADPLAGVDQTGGAADVLEEGVRWLSKSCIGQI